MEIQPYESLYHTINCDVLEYRFDCCSSFSTHYNAFNSEKNLHIHVMYKLIKYTCNCQQWDNN